MGNMVVVGGHDFNLRNVYDYGSIVRISAEAVNLIVARGYPMSVTPQYGGNWDSDSTWHIGHGSSFGMLLTSSSNSLNRNRKHLSRSTN